LTGETQLRARRTRIKILRAIAGRDGVAGFSDIKTSTGLSTGSIYYHLERMGSYITKDSKHYMITEEGLQFLREADPKYSGLTPPKKEEQVRPEDSGRSEETVRQTRYGTRQYAFVGAIAAVVVFAAAGALTGWQVLAVFAGINAGVAASAAAAATLLASFVMLGRRSYPIIGYKGTIVSMLALGVVLTSLLVFSSPQFIGAAPAQSYDNSMDALLSSYSMHWQIR
jgi:predicted transcriptional regulator